MSLSIGTNDGAMRASQAASIAARGMEASMERLSSGKRINSASDDAAGVAISSRLSAEIRGTNQSVRNALDAQALLDTAEADRSVSRRHTTTRACVWYRSTGPPFWRVV